MKTFCTKCISNYLLFKDVNTGSSSCVKVCPDGYTSDLAYLNCLACDIACILCDKMNNFCLKCKNNLLA